VPGSPGASGRLLLWIEPDGTVVGSLDCTFTSGTGRFAGATGGYDFFLVATPQPGVFPPIFETEATIMGLITP